MKIQARDPYGHPVTLDTETTLLLSSGAENAGEFYYHNGSGFVWEAWEAYPTIHAGSNATTFIKYKTSQIDPICLNRHGVIVYLD